MSSRSERTRRRILEAAHGLLEQGNLREVGLETVASLAGVSRQTVYLHFGSRAGLLVALAAHIDETGPLPELGRRVWEAPTALDALDRFVTLNAEYWPFLALIARALDAARFTDADAEAMWRDRGEDRWGACRQIVGRVRKEGLLSRQWRVGEATDVLWELTSSRTWEDLVGWRGWTKARYESRMRSMVRAVLIEGPTRRSGGKRPDRSYRGRGSSPSAKARMSSPSSP